MELINKNIASGGLSDNVMSVIYRDYLDECAKHVIKKIPRPFGSFEKAKYIVSDSKSHVYTFITSCYSQDEVVGMMKKTFCKRTTDQHRNYKIHKIINGKTHLVFSGKIEDEF